MNQTAEQQLYISSKVTVGSPMTRGEYNELQGWDMPENEDGDDEGYLVQYLHGGKPNHPDFPYYISWSPKEVFEQSNQVLNVDLGLISELQPHELRLVIECSELDNKIHKLEAFLNDPEKFEKLSGEDASLLALQLRQMKPYFHTLQERVTKLASKVE